MQLELLLLQELLCARHGGCCKEKLVYKLAQQPRRALCVQLGTHRMQQAVHTCATQHAPRVQQGMQWGMQDVQCTQCPPTTLCPALRVHSWHPNTAGPGVGVPPRPQRGAGQTQARRGQPPSMCQPLPHLTHLIPHRSATDPPCSGWAAHPLSAPQKQNPHPSPPARCMLLPPGAPPGRQPALFSRRFYSHSHSHQISHGPEAPRLQGLH